jgi:hypothetical protein
MTGFCRGMCHNRGLSPIRPIRPIRLEIRVSVSSLIPRIGQIQRELSDLQRRLMQETKAENDKSKRIIQVRSSITKTTSASTIQSKMREMQREQEADRRREDQAQRRREEEALRHQRLITQELVLQKQLAHEAAVRPMRQEPDVEFDVFISHASEDKDDFVRPLAEELSGRGIRAWYDESTLKVGDSLRRKIDQGLARSRYGVVVLSSAFFVKNWPQYELDGMVAREMDGHKVILPIWHKVSKSEVIRFSPTLADKVAINSSLSSIEEIAGQLMEVIGAE